MVLLWEVFQTQSAGLQVFDLVAGAAGEETLPFSVVDFTPGEALERFQRSRAGFLGDEESVVLRSDLKIGRFLVVLALDAAVFLELILQQNAAQQRNIVRGKIARSKSAT